jgi:signal transduction histidine kinase
VLRLAAVWAQQVAGVERATVVGWFDGRPVLHHAGAVPTLPVNLLSSVAAIASSGRPVTFPGRGTARLAQAASRARVRALVAMPFGGRRVAGCLVVATGEPRRFAAVDMTAIARVADCITAVVDEWESVLTVRRQAFGRAVHDGLGQTLTSLVFAIRDVEEAVQAPTLRRRLRKARAHAARAVDEMRGILEGYSLAPSPGRGRRGASRRTAPR